MTVDQSEISGSVPPGKHAASGALLAVLACAGMAGAAGVALAAVAAHKISNASLATAATILMIHATAAVALCAVSMQMQSGWRWLITAGLMLFAAVLFSAAVSYHAVTGYHLVAMAAPTGGSMLIGSWFAVAVLTLLEAIDRR